MFVLPSLKSSKSILTGYNCAHPGGPSASTERRRPRRRRPQHQHLTRRIHANIHLRRRPGGGDVPDWDICIWPFDACGCANGRSRHICHPADTRTHPWSDGFGFIKPCHHDNHAATHAKRSRAGGELRSDSLPPSSGKQKPVLHRSSGPCSSSPASICSGMQQSVTSVADVAGVHDVCDCMGGDGVMSRFPSTHGFSCTSQRSCGAGHGGANCKQQPANVMHSFWPSDRHHSPEGLNTLMLGSHLATLCTCMHGGSAVQCILRLFVTSGLRCRGIMMVYIQQTSITYSIQHLPLGRLEA